MATALALAAVGFAQAEPARGAGDPGARSGQGMDQGMKTLADGTKKDELVGLPVESSGGEQLGSVVDVVRDASAVPAYVIVAIDNDTTAVPYDTARSMVRGDKVVMNPTRLTNSPKVKQTQWQNTSDESWRTQADRYWGSTRTATPGDVPPPRER